MTTDEFQGRCPLCFAPVIIDEYSDGNGGCSITYNYDYDWALRMIKENAEHVNDTYGGGT